MIAALRSINVTESELAAAKKAIKIDLEDASPAATLETMAVNLSLGAKEVIAPAQMVSMFEGVSLAEIQVRLCFSQQAHTPLFSPFFFHVNSY